MKPHHYLEGVEEAWRETLGSRARETLLVGINDEGVLLVLCSDKSAIRQTLEVRRDDVLASINLHLADGRKLAGIEFRDGDVQALTVVELLHAIREDIDRVAARVDALEGSG